MKWFTTHNQGASFKLSEIPMFGYDELCDDLREKLADDAYHVAHYFATMVSDEYFMMYVVLLNDRSHKIMVASYRYDYYSENELQSLAAEFPALHVFEREISERYGVKFHGAPWDKPLRFPIERFNKKSVLKNYPFYKMDGELLHEVNVGPIHAGVIEPGVFRFICNGERVLHLEIVLGFQHRGVEQQICTTDSHLRQTLVAESIAGDSSIAHTVAYCSVVEKLSSPEIQHAITNSQLPLERAVALELERIAMHIADTGALCMDIGYQLGQVACEALRTIVINTTQLWCGNRFGKGLVRPCGTYYPLTAELIARISENIEEVRTRYDEIRDNIKNTPSVLSRFEECGEVNAHHSKSMGFVGLTARASGVGRDIRLSHPDKIFSKMLKHEPVVREQGDVMARVMVRAREVLQSAEYVQTLLAQAKQVSLLLENNPIYTLESEANSMSIGILEGWRGEICHVAITDTLGHIAEYKIKDPSLHNWMALALAVRGEGISDFPICNKSFNLSYCGHDL